MIRFKTLSLPVLLLAVIPLISGCQATPARPAAETIDRTVPAYVQEADIEGIYNYSHIGQTAGFGGATEPSAMAALKAQGYTSVVSLRMEGEEGFDLDASRAAAEAAGLSYIHLPFNSKDPDSRVISDFMAVVDETTHQPPYIHCGSATRVAALWMIKRVTEDGMTVEAAQTEAEQIAGKPKAAVAFASNYLKESRD